MLSNKSVMYKVMFSSEINSKFDALSAHKEYETENYYAKSISEPI